VDASAILQFSATALYENTYSRLSPLRKLSLAKRELHAAWKNALEAGAVRSRSQTTLSSSQRVIASLTARNVRLCDNSAAVYRFHRTFARSCPCSLYLSPYFLPAAKREIQINLLLFVSESTISQSFRTRLSEQPELIGSDWELRAFYRCSL